MDCKIISTSRREQRLNDPVPGPVMAAILASAPLGRQPHQTRTGRPWSVRALLPPKGGAPAQDRCAAAFTLIEVLIASSLALVALAAVGSFSWFSSRSFVAMANYAELDQNSQLALDK